MAEKAGMTLEDVANKVRLPGHKGPHPEAYHQAVYDRLQNITKGLRGEEYSKAFRFELDKIAEEILTPGSRLNILLTGDL
jgi:hypothetical protein